MNSLEFKRLDPQCYYPFGMVEPGRSYTIQSFDYGYQGSLKDDDIKGISNSYTTFFRELDPRIARWLSIDPKINSYQSPYMVMNGNPMIFNDIKGDSGDFLIRDDKGKTTYAGNDGINDHKVYVTQSSVIAENSNDCSIDWDCVKSDKNTQTIANDAKEYQTLIDFGAMIYAESSGDFKESFAIGSTTINFTNKPGSPVLNSIVTVKGYSSAIGSRNYNNFIKNDDLQKGDVNYAMSAAINAILYKKGLSSLDFSNGADHWDGRDLLTTGYLHYRYQPSPFNTDYLGIKISNCDDIDLYENNVYTYLLAHPQAFKFYNVKGTDHNALWETRVAWGQTLFYKENTVPKK